MEIWGYTLSMLMGLSLGLIGGGGSILTVPILVYFFSTDPLLATSESLFIVGTTALLGGLIALFKKEVHLKTVVQFALASFLGVYLMKKIILVNIPETILTMGNFHFSKAMFVMLIFAILMLLVSKTMIQEVSVESETSETTLAKKAMILGGQGFFVGNVTGLVGAGGGFLIVPALVKLLKLKMREAIGSSLLIIAANSLFGFMVAVQSGIQPQWPTLIKILTLALVGLLIGRYFSAKVSETNLKKGFGYFVLLMGSAILVEHIFKFIK